MRVVFMGTPQLAAHMMETLSAFHDVVLAVTRPDAVSGRGGSLRPSAVKAKAQELGIPVLCAKKLGEEEIRALEGVDFDAICVAAFGCLLPDAVLDMPRYGCFNVHLSLLPRWRGAAPLERAILEGDERIGYSIMRMESGLDTGPYCLQEDISAFDMYLGDLEDLLAESGARALAESLEKIEDGGDVEWTKQSGCDATYAEKIGKDELGLEPMASVAENYARVRASSDAHPARAVIADRSVTVERACPADAQITDMIGVLEPGQAYFVAKRLILACSDGLLEVERLKPSGKVSMEGKAFCAGVQNFKQEPKPWGGIR